MGYTELAIPDGCLENSKKKLLSCLGDSRELFSMRNIVSRSCKGQLFEVFPMKTRGCPTEIQSCHSEDVQSSGYFFTEFAGLQENGFS